MRNLTFRSPKTEVKPSRIHGLGLFAKEPLAQGEIVAVKGGYIFTLQEWKEVRSDLDSAEIQIGEDLFISPARASEKPGSMVYTNHSCEPNIGIQGQIVFVAMRDIVPGEELTHDWATTDDLDYEMRCRCGTSSCRGIITGKDWMKKDLQKRYRGWFCWFLQRKIDGLTARGDGDAR